MNFHQCDKGLKLLDNSDKEHHFLSFRKLHLGDSVTVLLL